MPQKRVFNPQTNPPGYLAAASALYAAGTALYNAANHHGAINWNVIFAALLAAASMWARTKVTPVADPQDGAGRPLIPAPQQGVPPPPWVQELRDAITGITPPAGGTP
jgi:hypothetical protein